MWSEITKLPQLLNRCLTRPHPIPTHNKELSWDFRFGYIKSSPPPLSLQYWIYAVYHKVTILFNNYIRTLNVCSCDKLKQYFLQTERLQFLSHENTEKCKTPFCKLLTYAVLSKLNTFFTAYKGFKPQIRTIVENETST